MSLKNSVYKQSAGPLNKISAATDLLILNEENSSFFEKNPDREAVDIYLIDTALNILKVTDIQHLDNLNLKQQSELLEHLSFLLEKVENMKDSNEVLTLKIRVMYQYFYAYNQKEEGCGLRLPKKAFEIAKEIKGPISHELLNTLINCQIALQKEVDSPLTFHLWEQKLLHLFQFSKPQYKKENALYIQEIIQYIAHSVNTLPEHRSNTLDQNYGNLAA